jgi:hypothetical protein
MSRIVLTTPQVVAVAKLVDEANNANAHGYSVGYTGAVKMTSTVAGLVVMLVDENGDANETWLVHSDGRVEGHGATAKPALF